MKPVIAKTISYKGSSISVRIETLESQPIFSLYSEEAKSEIDIPLDVALKFDHYAFKQISNNLIDELSERRREKYYPSKLSKKFIQDPINSASFKDDCLILSKDADKEGYFIPYIVWRRENPDLQRLEDGWALYLTGLDLVQLDFVKWYDIAGIKALALKMANSETLKAQAEEKGSAQYESLTSALHITEIIKNNAEQGEPTEEISRIAKANPDLYPSLDRISVTKNYGYSMSYLVQFFAPTEREPIVPNSFFKRFSAKDKYLNMQSQFPTTSPGQRKQQITDLTESLKEYGWNLLEYSDLYPVFTMVVSKLSKEDLLAVREADLPYHRKGYSKPKINRAEFIKTGKTIMQEVESWGD